MRLRKLGERCSKCTRETAPFYLQCLAGPGAPSLCSSQPNPCGTAHLCRPGLVYIILTQVQILHPPVPHKDLEHCGDRMSLAPPAYHSWKLMGQGGTGTRRPRQKLKHGSLPNVLVIAKGRKPGRFSSLPRGVVRSW